ncbi:MAG: hypothetical protein ACREU7_15070 [Burkholderiales bacterium]
MLAISFPVHAQEAEPEEPPDLELLEFIADWETDDGALIDPAMLEEERLARMLDEAAEREDE